jgi:adenine deaminase
MITAIDPIPDRPDLHYLLPGLIDAHIHIESSMLPPAEFARIAAVHGTVATVSDPHEIANVLGVEGIDYMLDSARHTPFFILFGAPSCVPATPFETSGATLDAQAVDTLLQREEIGYLSEMMNYPGVIHADPEVMGKIVAAKRHAKPIDGHAPGVRSEDLRRYIAAGITTDHESSTREEAREKVALGMKILIREGSAAKNYDALAPLIAEVPEKLMFCSDDRHPDDLIKGHINRLVARAVKAGYDLFDVLRIACLNPIDHYGLPTGRLKIGDRADFIETTDLQNFPITRTVIKGRIVAESGRPLLPSVPSETPNRFAATPRALSAFEAPACGETVEVIEAYDHELLTGERQISLPSRNNRPQPDVSRDILKICVLNRYTPQAEPTVAFIKGFGLRKGAIASSVAHDSHNIVAVGCDDKSLAAAVNKVIEMQGGLAAVSDDETVAMPLPIAGLMSDRPAEETARNYQTIDTFTKTILGSRLDAPFMTLSFMALPVIPALKLSDRGLFDARTFHFIPLCAD